MIKKMYKLLLLLSLFFLIGLRSQAMEAVADNENEEIDVTEISTVSEWLSIGKMPPGIMYRLTADIDVNKTLLTIAEGRKIIIDLNGHTIKGNDSLILNSGELKIVNSSDMEGKILIQCDETAENNICITGIENTENAALSLENICVDINTDLFRKIEKTESAEFYIKGIINYGTLLVENCDFTLKGTGGVDFDNVNLRVYGIENYNLLNVEKSNITLEGKAFSNDSYSGKYCSCLLFGIYNDSEKEAIICESNISVNHYITESECSRDKSCGIYNIGSGNIELQSADITCKLIDCVEKISSYIYGIRNAGTGNFDISGGIIDVSTQGESDRFVEVYGIYNQGGVLKVGLEDVVTEIYSTAVDGSAWGIYDSLRESAAIDIYCAKLSAKSNDSTRAIGMETSSRSVAEVKLGNVNDMTSLYPRIEGTRYAVMIGSGSQECYIYSGVFGSESEYQIFGVTEPENYQEVFTKEGGVTYLSFVPQPCNKWMKDAQGWWYLKADGSYLYNCWQYIDNSWYYFDAEGYMKTGWLYDEGQWYYLGADGSMAMGWRVINNIWYFFLPTGSMASERWIGEYYVNETGAWVEEPIHFSELTIDLAEEEYLYDGIEKKPQVIVKDADEKNLVEGTDYIVSCKEKCIGLGQYKIEIRFKGKYVGSRDLFLRIKTNPSYGIWMKDKIGSWYRRSDGSYPKNGWERIDGVWYYFNQKGYRMTGWIMTGGKWYYLQEKGNREETQHVDNPYEGVMLCNAWFADKDGQLYYLQSDGSMKIGWMYQNQKWYYLKANGSMAKDQWIDGYYVGEDGVWQQSY